MMGNVANPVGLEFTEWATAFINDNGIDLTPPLSELDWRIWAGKLRDAIDVGGILPNPDQFVLWSDWVEYALPVLQEMDE